MNLPGVNLRNYAAACIALGELRKITLDPGLRETFEQAYHAFMNARLVEDEFNNAELPALLRKQA